MGRAFLKGFRFSLQTTLLVITLLAVLCTVAVQKLTYEDRSWRTYTISNHPADVQFKSDLDAWFLKRGFKPFMPDYQSWPRQSYRRDIARGTEYLHYMNSQRGSNPVCIDVMMHTYPKGQVSLQLSWGYESMMRQWERGPLMRRGNQFFDELIAWCEAYPSNVSDLRPP